MCASGFFFYLNDDIILVLFLSIKWHPCVSEDSRRWSDIEHPVGVEDGVPQGFIQLVAQYIQEGNITDGCIILRDDRVDVIGGKPQLRGSAGFRCDRNLN